MAKKVTATASTAEHRARPRLDRGAGRLELPDPGDQSDGQRHHDPDGQAFGKRRVGAWPAPRRSSRRPVAGTPTEGRRPTPVQREKDDNGGDHRQGWGLVVEELDLNQRRDPGQERRGHDRQLVAGRQPDHGGRDQCDQGPQDDDVGQVLSDRGPCVRNGRGGGCSSRMSSIQPISWGSQSATSRCSRGRQQLRPPGDRARRRLIRAIASRPIRATGKVTTLTAAAAARRTPPAVEGRMSLLPTRATPTQPR